MKTLTQELKKRYEVSDSTAEIVDTMTRIKLDEIVEWINRQEEMKADVRKMIRDAIIDSEIVPSICEDSEQPEWTVGEAQKLADWIVQKLGGKK